MKLKTLYAFSVMGLVFAGFGSGWITLSHILALPMDKLTVIGASFLMVGMAVIIATLSTIKKIDLLIEEEK